MKELTLSRLRALVVFSVPVVLLIGFLVYPFPDGSTAQDRANAALGASNRWAWGNVIIALGIGLMTLAAFAIRTYLRDAGEERWSAWAVPLIVLGNTLIQLFLGLDGLARGGLADGGLALEAALDGSAVITTVTAAMIVLYAIGWLLMAVGIAAADVMSRAEVWTVFVGLVVFVAAAGGTAAWTAYAFVLGTALFMAPIGRDLWLDAEITTHTPMATPRIEFRAAHGH